MESLRVLNLYAGIGGNRKLWEDVDVTAVEYDPKIAAVYQELFPDDTVLVEDAHQYLLDHFKEFDFIWSSPPCPTHSCVNNFLHHQGVIRYPDMKLWQEIVFLKTWYKGLYCMENVKSYYEPFITPYYYRDRHYLWSNFYITEFEPGPMGWDITNAGGRIPRVSSDEYLNKLQEHHGIVLPDDLTKTFKIKVLKNCLFPPLGKHILNCARGNTQQEITAFSKSLRIEEK